MSIDGELTRARLSDLGNKDFLLQQAGANTADVKNGLVTVYRATADGKINDGDFVTPSLEAVQPYLNQRLEIGQAAKLIKKVVPIDHLLMGDEPTDFVYAPKLTAKH